MYIHRISPRAGQIQPVGDPCPAIGLHASSFILHRIRRAGHDVFRTYFNKALAAAQQENGPDPPVWAATRCLHPSAGVPHTALGKRLGQQATDRAFQMTPPSPPENAKKNQTGS